MPHEVHLGISWCPCTTSSLQRALAVLRPHDRKPLGRGGPGAQLFCCVLAHRRALSHARLAQFTVCESGPTTHNPPSATARIRCTVGVPLNARARREHGASSSGRGITGSHSMCAVTTDAFRRLHFIEEKRIANFRRLNSALTVLPTVIEDKE